jgi:LacI family transcriptional regulator
VPPTIYDIAERAGVSTATVSRVFNDQSEVADETRSRVMEAAQTLNYQPHASAQSLARQRTHLIAAVVPVLATYFYMGVLRGVQDALASTEFDLLVYTPSHPGEVETQLRRASQRGRSDGLMLLSTAITPDIAEVLESSAQEIVAVDTEHASFESIAVDNEEGGYRATQHLLNLGRTRVAHITTGQPEPPPAAERRAGYERALSEAGDASPMVARGDKEPFAFSREGGYRAMNDLLGRESAPDAVFAASDMQAIGALQALRDEGKRVPEDVALIGFDDIEISEYVGLSTLRQPLRDFGKLAVEKMVARLDDPERTVSSTVFAPELLIRRTCGGTSSDASDASSLAAAVHPASAATRSDSAASASQSER